MKGWSRKDLRDRHEKNVHAKRSCENDQSEAEPEAMSPSDLEHDETEDSVRFSSHPGEIPETKLWTMLQEEIKRRKTLEKRLEALQRRYDEREDKWLDLIAIRIGEKTA